VIQGTFAARAWRSVPERAGFRLEASLRSDDRAPDGSLRDTLVYACLRAEWSDGLRSADAAERLIPKQRRVPGTS
jgi:hypothetical protein